MNEFDLIAKLAHHAHAAPSDLVCGIGDDCAVIRDGARDLLITTDAYVECVHFTHAYIDDQTLGKRLFHATASDIAAMGGIPRFLVICLGIARDFGPERCDTLYHGLCTAAEEQGAALIGGDTVSSPHALTCALTMLGEVDAGKAILRGGARAGDVLYVTGTLGDAALGLACLARNLDDAAALPFIERYRLPTARLAAGQWLRMTGMVTSMIDVSDGLLADIGHLADASKTGYELLIDRVPRRGDFEQVAARLSCIPQDLILGGGDDYELAFTVACARTDAFEHALKEELLPFDHAITRIGTILEDAAHRIARFDNGSVYTGTRTGYVHHV